jgi:hypothetical protein
MDNPNELVNYNIDYSKWNIEQCQGNWIWLLMVDEPDGEIVQKGLIFVKQADYTKNAFRIGLVMNAGKDCKVVEKDKFVLIPPGNGVPGHKTEKGNKTWFIREDMILGTVVFDGTKDQMIESIKKDLQTGA